MKVVFSDHAKLKIEQRKLSEKKILETVKFPDFMKPSYSLREERYKNFGKNWLKAVVIKEKGTIVVITAQWIAKVKE